MKPGDVLLVRGKTKKSTALVAAQKIFYRNVRSSHAAIAYAENSIIHSTGDRGVHLSEFIEELESCEEHWRVIRLRNLTAAQEENLQNSSLYFVRQIYNKVFLVRKA